ncbi:MAG: OmpA family protein [Gammaproteobacteria bacterium]|nr:OmpA family protein [Gammaproteobacteria bacterium]
MRKLWGIAALSAIAAPASAVNTEHYRIPYLGGSTNYVITDSVREGDNGYGYQATFGVPTKDESRAWELTFFDHAYKRSNIDNRKNYQTGILIDYVRDFGYYSWKEGESALSFMPAFKPFWVVGAGFVEEDTFDDKHLHPAIEAGVGALMPIRGQGWGLRVDARGAFQFNKETPEQTAQFSGKGEADKASVLDFRIMLGLQFPLTVFFDRELPVPAAKECEIAVVDPQTGRTDCAADSDRDGVADTADRCPATPPATAVDATGCARIEGPLDDDGDGVPDETDRCPATRGGIKVDESGCAVTQTFNLFDVSFAPDSADLTDDGRRTLDGVADTLLQQENLKVEVAGHTDSIGSEAYNMLLSQQRAEAVVAYFVEKGLASERLSAIGYGESQPLASNESEEGRAQNRRVEFRILAD